MGMVTSTYTATILLLPTFFLQILNPFYAFLVFSLLLWMLDDYVFYATGIIIITLISVAVSLYETRTVRKNILDWRFLGWERFFTPEK